MFGLPSASCDPLFRNQGSQFMLHGLGFGFGPTFPCTRFCCHQAVTRTAALRPSGLCVCVCVCGCVCAAERAEVRPIQTFGGGGGEEGALRQVLNAGDVAREDERFPRRIHAAACQRHMASNARAGGYMEGSAGLGKAEGSGSSFRFGGRWKGEV